MLLRKQRGFTLVELMIIVLIIGLLAAMAIPAIHKSRVRSQATHLANNFRVYSQAFEVYATEQGSWPPDASRGVIPTGMEGQLPRFDEESVAGGWWDWEGNTVGVRAGLSLVESSAPDVVFEKVDIILDDGNLSAGRFIHNGDRVTLVLEQ